MVEPSHHPEVLRAGEVLVDGGELTGEPDQAAHDVGLGGDVVTEHPGHCRCQAASTVVRIRTAVVLPAPFGTEQPEDRAWFHAEADTVESPHGMAEGLVQVLQLNGERHADLLASAYTCAHATDG